MKNVKMFTGKVTGGIMGSLIMMSLAFGLFMPLSADAAALYRQLQLGMRGSDVSDLQVFLATDVSIYPQGLVTGYFGNLTSAAVSRFQTRNGLPTVGRVGPLTMAAINAQMLGGTGDRSAPVISSLSLSPATTGATINWNTSENASAIVYYSTSPISLTEGGPGGSATIGGTSLLVHTDLRSSHSATLSGLSANTTYYYVVYARDAAGNENLTWPTTFKTAQ